jgi:hypothetical protein
MTPAMRLATRSAAAASLLVTLLAAGCLDRGAEDLLGNTAPDPMGRQQWTVILADDAGGAWIAQTDSVVAVHGDSSGDVRAALWSVLDSAADLGDLRFRAEVAGRQMHLAITRAGESVVSGVGALYSYVGNAGAPRFAGSASLTVAGTTRTVRFDAIGGVPMPELPIRQRPGLAPRTVAAPGIVSLRIDDCGRLDSASLGALQRFHLIASFAVPSRLVGRATSCSPALLRAIADAGNAVEAHSRLHSRPPATFADFYLETVGSQRDLAALGYDARIFVQPGSWNAGPTLFDSPAKLDTPYGALLRRTYDAVEAYQQADPLVPIPADGVRWPTPREITFLSVEQVDRYVREAAAGRGWIEFMWHSGAEARAVLEAKLAVIAALRDSGYVANLPFRDALHAVHSGP